MKKLLDHSLHLCLLICFFSLTACIKQHTDSRQSEILTNGNRQVLHDAERIPYLFMAFDNRRRHSRGNDNPRFNLTQDEMEIFCQNIMLDIKGMSKGLSEFHYVIIHFFDFETKATLGRFKYLL